MKYDRAIEIRSARSRRALREEDRHGKGPDDRDRIGDQDRGMVVVNDVDDTRTGCRPSPSAESGTPRPASRRRWRIRKRAAHAGILRRRVGGPPKGRSAEPSSGGRGGQIGAAALLDPHGGAELGAPRSREHEHAAGEEHRDSWVRELAPGWPVSSVTPLSAIGALGGASGSVQGHCANDGDRLATRQIAVSRAAGGPIRAR